MGTSADVTRRRLAGKYGDECKTWASALWVGFDRTFRLAGAYRLVVGLDVRRIRELCAHPRDGGRVASTPPAGEAGERAGIYGWPALGDSAGMGGRRSHSGCAYRLHRSPPHAHALDLVVRRLYGAYRALPGLLVLYDLLIFFVTWSGSRQVGE